MKKNFTLFFLLSTAILVSGCSRKNNVIIHINGSSTIKPVMEKIAADFSKGKNVEVIISDRGSKKGLAALIQGKCEIAASSVKISEKARKKAVQKGLTLKEYIIGHDIIVPIVHPSNPVTDVTAETLKKIYTKKIINWKEQGGTDSPILTGGRNNDSGTAAIWEKRILGGASQVAGRKFSSNSALLAFVAENRNAIGYISAHFLNREVSQLSVNGMKPSGNLKITRGYPAFRNLYLYTASTRIPKEVESLIVFTISREGQAIISAEGYVPLSSIYGDNNSQ